MLSSFDGWPCSFKTGYWSYTEDRIGMLGLRMWL